MSNAEKPPVKSYYGGKPNYCTPEETHDVDAVNMTLDRVDKTATREHEPVYAFRRKGLNDFCTCDKRRYDELAGKPNLFEVTVFYTAPPKKKWVGLTDEDLVDCESEEDVQFVKRIEAKLKEKNT